MSVFRRIRAALGIGVTWAIGWGVTGAVVFTGFWYGLAPYQRGRLATFAAPADFRVAATAAAAVVGLISGMLFALLLSASERQRDINRVSGRRTALLGAISSLGIFLAGAAAMGVLGGALIPAVVFAAFGAASASGTLRLARRGSIGTGSGDGLKLPSIDDDDARGMGGGPTYSAFCLAPLLIVLAACSEGNTGESDVVVVRDSAGIRIVENAAPVVVAGGWTISPAPILEIGANEADSMQRLHSVEGAVRLSDRRIVVANAAPPGLRWYDSTGVFLHGTGRGGQGPGEFDTGEGTEILIWSLWTLPGDSIATWEHSPRRVQVFDPEGRHVRAAVAELPPGMPRLAYPQLSGAFGGGLLLRMTDAREEQTGPLHVVKQDSVEYFRYASDGKFVRRLARRPGYRRFMVELPGRQAGQVFRSQMIQPFAPVFADAASGDRFYYGAGDGYEIAAYDTTGTVRALIRRTAAPRPMTSEIIQRYRSNLLSQASGDPANLRAAEERLEVIPFPDSLPAYRALRVDREGMLWVQAYEPRGMSSDATWSVFDREGRWVTDVEIPTAWRITEIGRDYILTVQADDLGVQRVRMYGLRRGPG